MQVATSHGPSMLGMSMVKLRLSAAGEVAGEVGWLASMPVSMTPTVTPRPVALRQAPSGVAPIMLHVPLEVGERLGGLALAGPLAAGRRGGRGAIRAASGAPSAKRWGMPGRLVPTEWLRAAPAMAASSRTSSRKPASEEVTSATPAPSVTSTTVPPAAVDGGGGRLLLRGLEGDDELAPARSRTRPCAGADRPSGASGAALAPGAAPAPSAEMSRTQPAPEHRPWCEQIALETP